MFEDGWGERWGVVVFAVVFVGDVVHDGLSAGVGLVACVGVGRVGVFEGEADVLAAAGDGGPVDQFVWMVLGGLLAFTAAGGHGDGLSGEVESEFGCVGQYGRDNGLFVDRKSNDDKEGEESEANKNVEKLEIKSND